MTAAFTHTGATHSASRAPTYALWGAVAPVTNDIGLALVEFVSSTIDITGATIAFSGFNDSDFTDDLTDGPWTLPVGDGQTLKYVIAGTARSGSVVMRTTMLRGYTLRGQTGVRTSTTGLYSFTFASPAVDGDLLILPVVRPSSVSISSSDMDLLATDSSATVTASVFWCRVVVGSTVHVQLSADLGSATHPGDPVDGGVLYRNVGDPTESHTNTGSGDVADPTGVAPSVSGGAQGHALLASSGSVLPGTTITLPWEASSYNALGVFESDEVGLTLAILDSFDGTFPDPSWPFTATDPVTITWATECDSDSIDVTYTIVGPGGGWRVGPNRFSPDQPGF